MSHASSPDFRQGTFSILFTLLVQHQDSTDAYRAVQEELEDQALAEWLHQIEHFHHTKALAIRTLLEDMPQIPVKLSKQSNHILREHKKELVEAARDQHTVKILKLVQRAEDAISAEYRRSLQNRRLPDGIRTELKSFHSEIVELNRRVERIRTVPRMKFFEV